MNLRILGTIGMICAPALLVEILLTRGESVPLVTGIASTVFMFGSFCSHLGLWHLKATGTSWWGRSVLILQMVLVAMACLFGLFEAMQLFDKENPIFAATDAAWPLSMLTMNLVGITTAAVGRLQGWRRFAIIPCGLSFPLGIIASVVTGQPLDSMAIGVFFFGMLAVFWCILGFVVRQSASEGVRVAIPRVA